jgi:hypothetical protein
MSSKQNVAVDGVRFGNRATEEASGRRRIYKLRDGGDVWNPTYVCALGNRRGPGGWRRWGSPLAAITLAAASGFNFSL